MTDLITAAQQALEALEWHLERGAWGADIEGVTEALRAALAQEQAEPRHLPIINDRFSIDPTTGNLGIGTPELAEPVQEPVQEPVAWMIYTEGGTSAYVTDNPNDLVGAYRALALYTAPPQRKPEPVQEPVAWIYQNANTDREYLVWRKSEGGRNWRPLYTVPPQRKPLDDLAIADIYTKWDATPGTSMADFARAIERAHGIGGQDD